MTTFKKGITNILMIVMLLSPVLGLTGCPDSGSSAPANDPAAQIHTQKMRDIEQQQAEEELKRKQDERAVAEANKQAAQTRANTENVGFWVTVGGAILVGIKVLADAFGENNE